MKPTSGTRGSALPETAIVIAVVLLIICGSLQIALYGFGQVSADGAAFVTANSMADGGANGAALGASVFPGIAQANIVADTTQPSIITVKASTNLPGLPFVPGMPGTMTFTGADIEPNAPPDPGAPQSYSFGVTANLNNYCPYQNNCVWPNTYPMHLASTIDYSGNGKNGAFAEWYCHQGVYGNVSFPASRPTPGPTWNPADSRSGAEYTIYSWDSGTPC